MGLIHTDTPVSDLKINKFASVADFEAAQAQSLIGADEISFIDEAMQVDWSQSDDTEPDYIKNKPDLKPVATSGSYNDLTNKPTIPSAPGTLNTTATTAQSTSSSEALSGNVTLHKIAKTGSYSDLIGKPTIPAAQVNTDWNSNSGVSQILNRPDIEASTILRIYRSLTGTAGTSTSPYRSSKWDITDTSITSYTDGMVVSAIVPVAGLSTYGTVFQINNLGYKPVVYNINTVISTRYSVGSVVWMTYNSTQTANWYDDSSTATTETGCWQIMDYGTSDTNSIGYILRTNSSTRPTTDKFYRYRLLFSSPDNTQWIPSNTSTSTNSTALRDVTQRPINPFGRIVYYATTTAINAGADVPVAQQHDQNVLILGYSFNRTGAALVLTYPAPVYIKCQVQADGSAIIDSTTPYVQALPSTNDGKIYIYLGQAYDETHVEMTYAHPIYYHDGTRIRQYSGDATGGGGGGDTVTGKTVTLGTTGAAVMQVNGVDAGSVSLPSGSTSGAGIVQLTDSTSSTSTTTAATPNSVKSAYDLAAGAIPKSTGTTGGDIIYFTGASTPTRLAKGTAGQVLTMNSGATAPEWQTPSSGGLTNYNFTHTTNTTVTSPFTFTCSANQRNSQMITTGANLTLNITCNNGADNYLWIKNSSSSVDIDIAIGTVTYNGTTLSASSIYLPSDGISVPKSGLCEIGIITNADGCIITTRSDLAPSA